MNEPIGELRIQRLVDDAMTDEERREFLDGLDRRPESWREVALAFVEEQIWRREIGIEHSRLGAAVESRAKMPRPDRKPSWGLLAAVAACFLILPCFGFYLGQVTPRASIVAASENQGEIANDSEEPLPALWQPVYPQKRMDNDMQPQMPGVRTLAAERLESLGYRLDAETQYFSGQLGDGRRLVVPVRTVMVNYYGQ